jgi:hypothetical protein
MVVIVSRPGDPLPVRAFVWVDSWQQQCCGEGSRVSSGVHWHGHRTRGRKSWITTLLEPEWADAVEYEENHHGPPDELNPVVELYGTVRSIRVVTCDRKAKPNSTSFSGMPVPGKRTAPDGRGRRPLEARAARPSSRNFRRMDRGANDLQLRRLRALLTVGAARAMPEA